MLDSIPHAYRRTLFLAGCGKPNFFIKNPSAPCDETGFLPLVLPLWGRLQRGKQGAEGLFPQPAR